jgi:hypothetical protein
LVVPILFVCVIQEERLYFKVHHCLVSICMESHFFSFILVKRRSPFILPNQIYIDKIYFSSIWNYTTYKILYFQTTVCRYIESITFDNCHQLHMGRSGAEQSYTAKKICNSERRVYPSYPRLLCFSASKRVYNSL